MFYDRVGSVPELRRVIEQRSSTGRLKATLGAHLEHFIRDAIDDR